MSRYYRYKNGQEVTVRPDLVVWTRYYMRSGTWAGEAYKDASSHQTDFAGRVVHIEGKRDGKYYIREDYGANNWTDDMFDPFDECICTSLL